MLINRHYFNLSRPSRINFAAAPVFNHRRLIAKALTSVLTALLCLFGALSSAQAQTVQNTQNTADASLRGGLQVDPSTLGMSLQIPLGGYPGRGGLSTPMTLSYGSKQWRIETVQGFPGVSAYHTQSEARYAEHSMSGWTSSLEPPEIEYVGAAQAFDPIGDPLCTVCIDTPDTTPYYVNRILVHMPDGSSHELRKSDIPVIGASLTLSGIYNAVDGSRLKYDADTATLYLPDGSRYLLAAPGGVKFIDRNGNTLSYNSANTQWTDTLGRVIGLPPLQNSAVTDLQYWIPGFDGTNRQVTFRYRTLANARTDTSQALRYRGTKNCPGYPESTVLAESPFVV